MRKLILMAVLVAAAVVGGIVYVLASGDDTRRTGAISRTYVAGKTQLLVAGQPMGFLKSASCGGVGAEVTRVEGGKAGPDGKQIGAAQYEPCELSFGLSMEPAIYSWISDALAGKAAAKSLTLQSLDFENKEISRLDLNQAVLTEFSMPAFDAANNDAAYMSIAVQPQTLNSKPGSGAVVSSTVATKQKVWQPANFKFEFAGLPLAKVSKVEGIAFHVESGTQRPLLENFTIVVNASDVGNLDQFLKKFVIDGQNAPANETTAKLTMLDSTLAATVGTVSFTGVGMTGGTLVGAVESGSESIAKRQFVLYAEGLSLNIAP
jgi:phage tail-like protein